MNDPDQRADTADKPGAEPRRRRRYPWIALGILLLLLAGAAAAPSLLSAPPVRDAVLGWYNQSIPGQVSAGELSLSWLGGQRARSVIVKDAQGRPVLELAELTTDLTLLDALRGRVTLGRTVARGLNVDLRFADDGTNNLATALAGEAAAREGGGPVFPVTGNMSLVDGRVAIAAPGIDPVLLENLSGAVSMSGLHEPVQLSFSGRSRQGDLQGRIDLDGRINGLFRDGALDPESATATLDARIEDLPVDALDRLLGFRGALSAALGDRTSIRVSAAGGADRQSLAVDAETPHARLSLQGMVADRRFRLQSPADARLTLTPRLVDELNRLAGSEPAARLAGPVPLELSLTQLDIPLEAYTSARVALDATLSAGDTVRLTDIENLGDLSINDLRLRVASPGLGDRIQVSLDGRPVMRDRAGELALEAQMNGLMDEAGKLQPRRAALEAESSLAGIPTQFVDTALQQGGLLVDALGETFDLALTAGTDPAGRVKVSANLESGRLRTGAVQVLVGDDITLAQPARLRLAVTPELGKRLLGEDAAYRLTRSSEWTVELETLRMPVPGERSTALQPDAVHLVATASSPSLELEAPDSGGVTRLENPSFAIAAGNGLGRFAFNGSSDVLQPGGPLASVDASPLRVTLEGETGFDETLSAQPVTSTLALSSSGVNARLATTIDKGFSRLTLAEPASFELILSPRAVAAWQDPSAPAVALADNAVLQGTLASLTVPLSPFGLAGVQVEGEAALRGAGAGAAGVTLQSPGGVVTRFDDARMAFEFAGADGGRGRIDLSAGVRSDRDQSGQIALEGSAAQLLDANGLLAADIMTVELDGTLQALPVALVDQFLNMDGTASATLGPTADIELRSRLQGMRGPVSLALNAPNATADVAAQLGERGLTLSQPLVARIEPTPEFGSKVLAKVHPIFETTQRAEQPMRFEVPPDGVLIPVADYDFSRIAVPKMTLDFGKVVLKSGWLLRGVIGLGQRFGKLDSVEKDEWVAWFTPGVMEINDGRITYSRRLDLLLAEKLHLATWGSADVSRDRADLTLAFMPDTMERVFSITVAGGDALRIPITGPLSGPGIDFKKAGADLARLRAQEEVSGQNSLAGALLGAVTGKATGGGPVPPASVTPLPWAEQLEALDAAGAQDSPNGVQEPAPAQQPEEPAPERKPSTEEQVIKGLIDIFGKQKKQE